MIPGEGVIAKVRGKTVRAGNRKLLGDAAALSRELTEEIDVHLHEGSTVTYVSIDGRLAGYIVLSDTLREESAGMIAALYQQHVRPVLLTGDHEEAAKTIGGRLGIREIHADCLPEDKLRYISSCQERGEAVCMIGDGVNDAPALKTAHVGIALGGIGSDIAVEAADIALVDDEIQELPHLLALSRRMMTTIKRNLCLSMGLNFLAIALAIPGILNPVVGALVHNAGSVVVIVHSALLLGWKQKRKSPAASSDRS